jgi:hypothetical protein
MHVPKGAGKTSLWHSVYAEPAPKPLPNAAQAALALPPPTQRPLSCCAMPFTTEPKLSSGR